MNITLTPEVEKLVRERIERGDQADYDEHTINHLANDVHQRGLKRLAETGTRG